MRAGYWWLCLCQMFRMGKSRTARRRLPAPAAERKDEQGVYMKGKMFIFVMMVTADICESNKTHWAGHFADECYAMRIINLFKGTRTWASVVWYIEVTFRRMLGEGGEPAQQLLLEKRQQLLILHWPIFAAFWSFWLTPQAGQIEMPFMFLLQRLNWEINSPIAFLQREMS